MPAERDHIGGTSALTLAAVELVRHGGRLAELRPAETALIRAGNVGAVSADYAELKRFSALGVTRSCEGCGALLPSRGRAQYCSLTCRKRANKRAERGGAPRTAGTECVSSPSNAPSATVRPSLSNGRAVALFAPIEAQKVMPPLKWAGGKRWLVPHLEPLWTPFAGRRLVEPFCGGLAVALGLMPERALLNDANVHAINFYQWLQRGLTIVLPMSNDSETFYLHRAKFNELIANGQEGSADAAALFYYLNRTCYNGLCRFNRRGQFNTPFGTYAKINYRRDFNEYSQVLAAWDFRAGDFEGIQLSPDDFVYADPPYDVQFTQYAQNGFGWDDQVRLAQWLAKHPGPVVLSNQATDRIVDLYTSLGFALRFLDAPRMINSTGDRSRAREVLATRGI